ncbi:putative MFS multidrug transporter [Rhexocercosporidium sp. MPI-PUGE-AT-0058]|nr:putative MFS multidrug transporter [Rhexocercosporidium sp. MPI-PUGE-AT-0058]
MSTSEELCWGHCWRSSATFTLVAIITALFTDIFLYGFIVPILPFMLEDRLNLDKSRTQSITLALLSESALVGLFASLVVGHIAGRTSNKRALLLLSLLGAMLGSLGLALSRTTFELFASRFLQALSSNAIFVIGIATISETIPSDRMGQAMGLITMAASVGTSAGTMLAGVLLELIGYWPTWCTAFALLAIDAVLRLLMIENKRDFPPPIQDHEPSETSSLLSPECLENYCTYNAISVVEIKPPVEEKKGISFYVYVLRQRRFLGGITSFMAYSIIISSFDTTLPLHVRDAFNWGSLQAGLMFLALQGPGVLLGPLAGSLKDRVGTRSPAAIAFFVMAPSVLLMGLPGDGRVAWLDVEDRGKALYIICMIVIGCMIPLLSGVGVLELTSAIEEMQNDCPEIFGRQGGNSRAISIANMSWIIGIFIGPIISGILTDKVGYFQMSCILAALCVLSGLNALYSLGPRTNSKIELADSAEGQQEQYPHGRS